MRLNPFPIIPPSRIFNRRKNMKVYFLLALGVFGLSPVARSRRANGGFENPYSSGQVGLPNNGSANPSDIIWGEAFYPARSGKARMLFLGRTHFFTIFSSIFDCRFDF